MKYKYNPKTHSVDELPEMKEPEHYVNKFSGLYLESSRKAYLKEMAKYRKHLVLLKSYPLPAETPAPDNWPEVLEEEINFHIVNNCKNSQCECDEQYEHNCGHANFFAIPINNKIIMEGKKSAQEIDEDFASIISSNLYNICSPSGHHLLDTDRCDEITAFIVQDIKQSFTIQPKSAQSAGEEKYSLKDMENCWLTSHRVTYTNTTGHNKASDDLSISFEEFIKNINPPNKQK